MDYDIESLSEKKNNHYKNWTPVGGISFLDNGGDYIFLTQSVKKWIHIMTFSGGKKREIDEDKLDPYIWGPNPLSVLRQMGTSEVKDENDISVFCDDCFEHEDDCECGTNIE